MTSQQIQQQINEYKGLHLHRKLGTNEGFFQFYYSELKDRRTKAEAFNYINDLYFDLFGEYKYSDFFSFRNSLNRYKIRR